MHNLLFLFGALVIGGLAGWYARESLQPESVSHISGNDQTDERVPVEQPVLAAPDAPQGGRQTGLPGSLENGDFSAALALYEGLLDADDEHGVAAARGRILNHASQLLSRQDSDAARQLLQAFLVLSHRDVEAHVLLAEAALAEKDYRSAIAHYYEAKGHAHHFEVIERLNTRIRSTARDLATTHQQHDDYSGMLDLYQYLTQMEPDHARYYIGLAKAQLALDNPAAARQSLQLVLQDAEAGPAARSLLDQLPPETSSGRDESRQEEAASVSRIPLHRRGHQYLVDSSFDGNRSVRLLIDTGASMTIITPSIIDRYSQSIRSTGRNGMFSTANGPVSAPIYRLDALTVGQWQVRDLEVGVLPLGSQKGFDGLLGMNFLKHFQFFIDQDEGVLNLSPN